MDITTQLLSFITALLTLTGVLVSMRKTYQTSGQIKAQMAEIRKSNTAAESARVALHNHLSMVEAGVAAAAAASARTIERDQS